MNKKVLLGIIISIILLMAAGTISYFALPGRNFLSYKDPQLTEEGIKIAEQRLEDSKKAVAGEQTNEFEKFNNYVSLGISYTSLGKLREAKESYNKAFKVRDDDANSHLLYSSLLVAMKDYDGALKAANRAIELEPTNPEFWNWRIAIEKDFFGADNKKQNDIYVQALTQAKNHIDMITAYARFSEQTGNLQVAKEYWQKAIEANPGSRAIYDAEITAIDVKLKESN